MAGVSSKSSSTMTRIIRCFCNCSEFSEEEIKRISQTNVSGLLNDAKAKELFRNFLKKGHKLTKSLALINLECCELCDKLLKDENKRTEVNYEELIELLPDYHWEMKLKQAQGGTGMLDNYFIELLDLCKKNIQLHPDYERFHQALSDKLK